MGAVEMHGYSLWFKYEFLTVELGMTEAVVVIVYCFII